MWHRKPRQRRTDDKDSTTYSGMNVSLTPELEKLVRRMVRSGRYNSASEVVREALGLLAHKDRERSQELQAIRDLIDRRYQEASEGKQSFVDGAEALKRLRR